MKKIILSAVALAGSFGLFAQKLVAVPVAAAATPGISKNAVYDDFGQTEHYTVETNIGSDMEIQWFASNDFYTLTRNAAEKELSLAIALDTGQYEVTGFGLGKSAGATGTSYTIDLSEDAELSVGVTNKSAVDEANVKFQLKDINGVELKYHGDDGISTANEYKYEIGFHHNSWDNSTKQLGEGVEKTYSYNFLNAVVREVFKNKDNEDSVVFTPAADAFDFTQVAEVIVLVTNKADIGASTVNGYDAYSPLPFNDTIILKDFKLGAVADIDNQKVEFEIDSSEYGTPITATQTHPNGFEFIGKTFMQDDFKIDSLYANETAMLNWWIGDAIQEGSELTRSGNGAYNWKFIQKSGGYEPVGLTFGGTGIKENTIDLTDNAYVYAKFQNNSGKTVKIKSEIFDIFGNSIDLSEGATVDDFFNKEGSVSIADGKIGYIRVNFNNGGKGQFTPKGGESPCSDFTGVDTDFEYNKVNKVSFAVVDADDTDGCPAQRDIDVDVDLLEFIVGSKALDSLTVTQGGPITETFTDEESGFSFLGQTFAKDDFKKATEYGAESGEGLYWWPEQDGSISGERKDGGMNFTVSQEPTVYEPVGLGFGDVDGEGYTIDLSQNGLVTVQVINTGDVDLSVRLGVKIPGGTDGTILDTKEGTEPTKPFEGEISETVAPGDTVYLQYDFSKAGSADYNVEPNNVVYGLSVDKVLGLALTVVSTNPETEALENGKIKVIGAWMGDVEHPNGILDFSAAANDFSVYPNPASSTVNFGMTLTNGAVYNAQGLKVDGFNRAETINVSSYEDGVYFIKATEGSSRFFVK